MSADQLTFAWLMAATLFTLAHVLRTYKARSSRSLSLSATLFFTVLAAWNAGFFLGLGQHWSAAGSTLLFTAHAGWLALQIRYRIAERRQPEPLSILDLMR